MGAQRSGDVAGQAMSPEREIMRPGNTAVSPLIHMHPRLNVPRIARYPEVKGTVQLPVLHVVKCYF